MKKDFWSERVHNYAFWTSLFAIIPLVCQAFGAFELPPEYSDLINAFLAFLIAIGVINDPKSGKWYLDKKDNN